MKYKSRPNKHLKAIRSSKTGSFSCKKTISPEVFKKLRSLKKMLAQQDQKCWDIGDLCIELLDRDRLALGDIAHATGYSRTRISHFHLTCRLFSPDERKGYTFQDSLTARQIHISLPRLAMTPVQIRDEICKLKNKTVRQVREHFVDILVKKEMARTVADSLIAPDSGVGLINNCHHSDWRKIIPKLPDQSVHLFICDPPFAQHKIKGKRGYVSSRAATNGMRNDSDYNLCEEEALSVTLPLFELCLPKLAPGGMLLLFQAGGRPDRIEVLQKAKECGWDCAYGLTWKKGELSVSNMQNPYRVCTERILLFCGNENKLTKCQNGLPHSDILDFPTETPTVTNKMNTGQMAYADYHMFQKPPALMEFLIQQHSHPGNLVVEAFGCSGSGCIAAARHNRRWIYIESNKANFIWGNQRILNAVKTLTSSVG